MVIWLKIKERSGNYSGSFVTQSLSCMNIAFSKLLKTPQHQLEFNFLKLGGDYTNFYADVTDEKGQRIAFNLYKNDQGNWMIQGQNVPNWISSMQTQLTQAIEEELKDEKWLD
jgi:hypothetical protein